MEQKTDNFQLAAFLHSQGLAPTISRSKQGVFDFCFQTPPEKWRELEEKFLSNETEVPLQRYIYSMRSLKRDMRNV